MDTSVRVLLVDDEPGIRHVLGALIRDFGYDVHTAESAREALEAFTANPFPIVVTDIRMPGMDGVAACKILRSELPEVRLLILTTFDDDEYLRELFGLGVDGYLLKTGSPPRLAEAVRGVYNGLGAVDAGVSRKLGSLLNAPKKPGTGPLTETELGITYGRTRNLVSAVYRKLGAVDREDLIARLDKE